MMFRIGKCSVKRMDFCVFVPYSLMGYAHYAASLPICSIGLLCALPLQTYS